MEFTHHFPFAFQTHLLHFPVYIHWSTFIHKHLEHLKLSNLRELIPF